MSWNLAQAKEHLEEIVDRAANDEPQVLEFGNRKVVIVSDDTWQRLSPEPAPRPRRSMKELLATLPTLDEGFEFERNRLPARDIEL